MTPELKAKVAGAVTAAMLSSANTLLVSAARNASVGGFDAAALEPLIEAHNKMSKVRAAVEREKLIGAALEVALMEKEETEKELQAAFEIAKRLAFTIAAASLGL